MAVVWAAAYYYVLLIVRTRPLDRPSLWKLQANEWDEKGCGPDVQRIKAGFSSSSLQPTFARALRSKTGHCRPFDLWCMCVAIVCATNSLTTSDVVGASIQCLRSSATLTCRVERSSAPTLSSPLLSPLERGQRLAGGEEDRFGGRSTR
eukprot:scaffold300127_cov33-Tisochrysis_lutea.AAC.1